MAATRDATIDAARELEFDAGAPIRGLGCRRAGAKMLPEMSEHEQR